MVELEVEATGVANWLLVLVAPPEWRDSCLAIGASHARAPVRLLLHIPGRLREGPVCVVVLVIEATGVAQIVVGLVAAP